MAAAGTIGYRRLRGLMFGPRALALADQAVVSGASFLTSVTIARFAGAGALGLYAIAISVLLTVLAVQESLVLRPYMIQRHQPVGAPSEHAGASLALSGMLGAAGLVLVGLGAVALLVAGEPSHSIAIACALAALVPFAMAREFARHFGFAHLRVAQVLALDVFVTAIQLGSLAVLGFSGHLSGLTACAALGGAYALGLLGWLMLARGEFALRAEFFRANLARSWAFGKWLLTGRITVQVQCYITYWMSVLLGGASMTGVFAACMSIVAFSNPVVFGLGNVLTPRSVEAWKTGGGGALLAQALRDGALLAGLMGAFCAVIVVAGADIMAFLYRGSDFAGHASILSALAVANAFLAIGMPATNALAAMERPRAVVLVQAIGAIATVALVSGLIVQWGLYGAAYGALIGSAIGAAARWGALLRLTRRQTQEPPVMAVLRQKFPGRTAKDWTIERLGEGDFAIAYLARPAGPRLVPDPAMPIVVKIYKPGVAARTAQDDAEALGRLFNAMDEHRAGGWTVHVPRPLFVSSVPPALVMTAVPGKDVQSLAADETVAPDLLELAGKALAAAMQKAWAEGIAHGDFGLRNVLLDAEKRQIAAIDPGTPQSCEACGALATYRPAARDLAHMICELTTDVSDLIGGEDNRVRRDAFVAALLTEVNAPELIAEIKGCAASHLDETLRPSWSARGLWHRLVKRLAQDRCGALFTSLSESPQRVSRERELV